MDAAINQLVDTFPSDSRASLIYDGVATRWSLTVDLMAEFEPSKGDRHRLQTRVKGSDAARGGEIFEDLDYTIACMNGLVVPVLQGRHSARHSSKIVEKAAEYATLSGKRQGEVSAAWREANVNHIVDGAQDIGASRVFASLVEAGYVHAEGINAEDMTQRLTKAWETQPGYHRAAFVHAITKAAHTETWRSVWTSEALEEQAGQLLYNYVT